MHSWVQLWHMCYRGDKLLLTRFKAYFTGEMNVWHYHSSHGLMARLESFWALGGTYYNHFIERTLYFQKSQLVQVQRIHVYRVLSQKWYIYITEMRSGRTGTKQFCSRLY